MQHVPIPGILLALALAPLAWLLYVRLRRKYPGPIPLPVVGNGLSMIGVRGVDDVAAGTAEGYCQ